MSKKVTIYDIAEKAGVSPSTVSRVLNNPDIVSGDVRDKVLTAADSLEYARNNRRKSDSSTHKKIALVIPDLSNPFFSTIVCGIQDTCQGKQISLTLIASHELKDYLKNRFEVLRSHSGIIYIPDASQQKLEKKINSLGIPVIYVDRKPADLKEFGFVGVDNRKSARNAARYLLSLKHHHVIFLSGPENISVEQDRLEGFRDALKENKLNQNQLEVVPCEFSRKKAYAKTAELLQERDDITAIFASDDMMAYGVIQALNEKGLNCPEDVSVLGFDDLITSSLIGLTTVHQPAFHMGKSAMHLLLDVISGSKKQETQILLNASLVIRTSCQIRS